MLGRIINTNAAYLSRKLAELGIDAYHQVTVGDNPQRLAEAIRKAALRADIIITSGGLGPTVDDVTAGTIALIAARKFKWITNRVGSAPGLIAQLRDKIIICLPGPPRELEPMFERDISPLLRKRSGLGGGLYIRTIKLTGLPESYVDRKAKDLLRLGPPTTVGIYAKLGQVDLVIMSKNRSSIAPVERAIKKRFKPYIFGYDSDTLEQAVGKALIAVGKTIAVAESCTGGLLSSRITDVAGSSRYFMAGAVVYGNAQKENLLGVKRETIKRYGAVSRQVALQMAAGIRHYACVDTAVAITGIAGPGGGSAKKPVGLVYIAFCDGGRKTVKRFRFTGPRADIKYKATQAALDLIRRNT